MEYSVIAGVALLLIVLYLVMKYQKKDAFNPYYEMPRREPNTFIRHPLEFKK